MPRALDPNNRFPVWLESDLAKPEPERPTFYARYLSGREWGRVSELADGPPTSVESLVGPVYKALEIGIVHWNNMLGRDGAPIPFDLSKLPEMLDPGEARELLIAMLRGAAMGKSDPKRLRVAVAIQFGQLCKRCGPGGCVDAPTPCEPAVLECPLCNGDGCDECDDGRFELSECPKEFVGRDAFDVLMYADLFQKGCPPIAGGAMDQTQWFLTAARFVWAEQSYWKAKAGAP